MSLIKCNECNKEISDKAKVCPGCGNPIKKVKPKKIKKPKDLKKIKKIIKIVSLILVILAILTIIGIKIYDSIREKNVAKNCETFTNKLQTYLDNKDYDGFDDGWFDHENLSTRNCDTIDCSCPSAWNLFIQKRLLKAKDLYEQGFISSAYETMGSNYITENPELQKFHDENILFKLISSEDKEKITGIYHSFGSWEWEHVVGGTLKFNKRYVNFASSNLSLKFDNYKDIVLISGHIASKEHPNWNSDKNISVEWYNYKVLDNKIYLKLENESEYDAMFEIVELTDTNLKLKLLISTTDVDKGQIYEMTYKRT